MSKWHAVRNTRPEQKAPTALDKQGAFTSIVREPAQNSTDNVLDEAKPVKMKFTIKNVGFTLVKDKYLPQNPWMDHVSSSPFYTGINRAADSQATSAGTEWVSEEPIPVLLIEDYNTTGLVGDTELYQHDPDETPLDEQNNTFYWLLRTLGLSSPSTGRGGSWGLGKLAFPLSSRVKTFFAVTTRDDTEDRYLLGQALLEYRKDIRNSDLKYSQMMYYADKHVADIEDHWIPIADPDEIDAFCACFGVSRGESEPGTSFVIPYPRNSDDDPVNDIEKLMCGVVNNYALAIMQGKLELEFVDEGDRSTSIDKNNFQQLLEEDRFQWEQIPSKRVGKVNASHTTKEKMLKLLELFNIMNDDDAGTTNECEEYELSQLDGGTELSSRFSETMPEENSAEFKQLKEAFDDGKFIKIKTKLPVVYSNGNPESDGLVEIVLQLCAPENADAAEAHYYRSQISLPMVNKKQPLRPRLASLVMVARKDGDEFSEMLRQSEGPAHLNWEWDSSTERMDKYLLGHSTTSYVKMLPFKIVAALSATASEGEELWKDIFNFGGEEGDPGEGDDRPPPPPPPPGQRVFTIKDLNTNDGFEITKREGASSLIGKSFLLRIGYPVPLPIKWDRPPDYRLIRATGDVSTWTSTDCAIEQLRHSDGDIYPDKVKLTINSDDFKLVVNTLEPHKKARAKLDPYDGKFKAPSDIVLVETGATATGDDANA